METTRRNLVISGAVGLASAALAGEAHAQTGALPFTFRGEIAGFSEKEDPHSGELTVFVTVALPADSTGRVLGGTVTLQMTPDEAVGLAYGSAVDVTIRL